MQGGRISSPLGRYLEQVEVADTRRQARLAREQAELVTPPKDEYDNSNCPLKAAFDLGYKFNPGPNPFPRNSLEYENFSEGAYAYGRIGIRNL